MESSTPQFVDPGQPAKKSNTGLIIAIVVIVLCCCCVVAIVGGLAVAGPAVNNVFSSINQSLQNPGMPVMPPSMPSSTSEAPMPGAPAETSEPSMPSGSGMPTISPDIVPQGGRGDDLLRTDAWAQVVLAAALTNKCPTPAATGTTISVSQDPDAAGVWKELWTVACGEGKTVPVDVTFTPSAGGGTDISVTVAK